MRFEEHFRPLERTRWGYDVIVRRATFDTEAEARASVDAHRRDGWIVRDCYPDRWDLGRDAGRWFLQAIRPATKAESTGAHGGMA